MSRAETLFLVVPSSAVRRVQQLTRKVTEWHLNSLPQRPRKKQKSLAVFAVLRFKLRRNQSLFNNAVLWVSVWHPLGLICLWKINEMMQGLALGVPGTLARLSYPADRARARLVWAGMDAGGLGWWTRRGGNPALLTYGQHPVSVGSLVISDSSLLAAVAAYVLVMLFAFSHQQLT